MPGLQHILVDPTDIRGQRRLTSNTLNYLGTTWHYTWALEPLQAGSCCAIMARTGFESYSTQYLSRTQEMLESITQKESVDTSTGTGLHRPRCVRRKRACTRGTRQQSFVASAGEGLSLLRISRMVHLYIRRAQ